MKITLYGRPYNRSDRVQWTLEELGLRYEYRKLDVFALEHRSAEIRGKYPLSRLPFVELDGRVLFESGAIMLVLAERFRAQVDLLPQVDTVDYSTVLQWLFFATSTLEASDPDLVPGDGPAPAAPLRDVLDFLDETLSRREYIAAGRFTIADIALTTGLKWLDNTAPGDFKHLAAYAARQTDRPAHHRLTAQAEYPQAT